MDLNKHQPREREPGWRDLNWLTERLTNPNQGEVERFVEAVGHRLQDLDYDEKTEEAARKGVLEEIRSSRECNRNLPGWM